MRNDLGMLPRVLLAVCAALVLAWVGVLVRDHYVGDSGAEKLLFDTNLTSGEFQRNMDKLSDSRFLNPSTNAELARAEYYLFRGRPRTR